MLIGKCVACIEKEVRKGTTAKYMKSELVSLQYQSQNKRDFLYPFCRAQFLPGMRVISGETSLR